MKLVLATRNRHKAEEIAAMLPVNFTVITMDDAGVGIRIDETGTTIRENSMIKAKTLFERIAPGKDIAVIADDSGLEVNALNGEPGVDSALYAGKHGDDNANNQKLLDELSHVTDRKARFVCVITYIDRLGTHVFEGDVTGTIAYGPRGDNGFGYDPLFIPTGYRSTFAELGQEVKNAISHRAKAVRKLCEYLRSLPPAVE